MKQEVRFFHCNEREEVIEIESYFEENGAIISLKQTEPWPGRSLSHPSKIQLEAAGWEIELAGTTRPGPFPGPVEQLRGSPPDRLAFKFLNH